MVAMADIPVSMRPYCPRGAARDVMLCRDPAILIDGPAGTGKSIGLLNKAYLCAEKYDGSRILLVRKTRKSMTESVLVTWENKVVPEGHPCLDGPSRKNRQSYDFPNGSSIVLGGMDSDHEAAVMSTDYDVIFVFEGTELTVEDYEKLLTRLRNWVMPYQQIVVDCNPASDKHWLKQNADTGAMRRYISRHEDNPLIYGDSGELTSEGRHYLEQILGKLTGVRRARLLEGKWASAEGAVYEDFDEAVHLIDSFPIPKDWRRVRSIDLGFNNPFVCGWWAIDGDGNLYLYRELYGVKRLVEDWAKDIVRLSAGEHIEATVADHDAEDRATLERHGVSTVPAYKSITTGIEAVSARIRKGGNGKPRLYIMRDALVSRCEELANDKKPCCTAEEFDCYVWPKGQDGKPNKEVPVKDNDHGMDMTRYLVAYVDNIAHAPIEIRVLGDEQRTKPDPFDHFHESF